MAEIPDPSSNRAAFETFVAAQRDTLARLRDCGADPSRLNVTSALLDQVEADLAAERPADARETMLVAQRDVRVLARETDCPSTAVTDETGPGKRFWRLDNPWAWAAGLGSVAAAGLGAWGLYRVARR